jgi:hypothetical protein
MVRLTGTLLLALLAAAPAPAAPAATDAFLARLVGDWDLTGAVRGRAVHQHAAGRWVLGGGWLRLALTDLARPPGYQASVYFGFDAKAGDYIVHWLDPFGAPGARVVGSGHRDGGTLVIVFPYAEGAFRDTLALTADAASGTLLLESQGKDGTWSTFASYALKRVSAQTHGGAE